MSKYVLVPVAPTEEMIKAACSQVRSPSMYHVISAAIAAAPQPNTGGEPEVLAVLHLGGFDSGELGEIDIEPRMKIAEGVQQRLVTGCDDVILELIDRAHFTALQARLQAADELLRRVVKSGVITCDPFEALEADCCAFLGDEKAELPKCSYCHGQGEVWTGENAYQGHFQPPEPVMVCCPECCGAEVTP